MLYCKTPGRWLPHRVLQEMIEEKLGEYTILKSVGSGSMGTVYKAEDRRSGRPVAVKLIRSQVLYDLTLRERFLQGVLAASEIRHHGICPILEIGDDNNDFFVITPFLEEATLRQRLDGGPIPWREACEITLRLLDILAAIHEAGALHRAIKPNNIRLRTDGSLLVTDCAIARHQGAARNKPRRFPRIEASRATVPLNSLAYLSPEQVRGDNVDARSDLFSCGAVLYEMLTGRPPFDTRDSLARMSDDFVSDAPAPSSLVPGLPRQLDLVLQRALATVPEVRYPDAREFSADLRRVCTILPGAQEDPGTAFPDPPFRRIPSSVLLAGGLVLLVILALLVYYLLVA